MHQQFIPVASDSGRYHQRVAVNDEADMANSGTIKKIVQAWPVVDL
jgi:hypothetical protein